MKYYNGCGTLCGECVKIEGDVGLQECEVHDSNTRL